MPVLPTTTTKYAALVEAAYAAGKGAATKYLCTPLVAADVGLLTIQGSLPAERISMGMDEYDRLIIHPVGASTAAYTVLFNKGLKQKEMKIVQYVQNSTWMAAAIQAASGAIPTSYMFHVEICGALGAIAYFDIMGCVVQDYECTIDTEGLPIETITFLYYKVVTGAAVTTMTGFLETQPITHGTASVTIGAAPLVSLKKAVLKYTNTLLDTKVVGKYYRMDPVLKTRDAELDLTYYDDNEGASLPGLLGDSLTETPPVVTATVVFITAFAKTMTLTNMSVEKCSLGEFEPLLDLYEHNALLKNGTACALT